MILELAQKHYGVANLYNALLEHYEVMPAAAGPDAAAAPTLGRDFSFQFSYEHSAAAAARRNPAYRYVHLPDRIDLSASSNAVYYAQASVTMPGLGITGAAPVGHHSGVESVLGRHDHQEERESGKRACVRESAPRAERHRRAERQRTVACHAGRRQPGRLQADSADAAGAGDAQVNRPVAL